MSPAPMVPDLFRDIENILPVPPEHRGFFAGIKHLLIRREAVLLAAIPNYPQMEAEIMRLNAEVNYTRSQRDHWRGRAQFAEANLAA